jgi:hypothetical protein
MARELLYPMREDSEMETVVIAATLLSSFAGAFVIQKAALEGLFRMMQTDRRDRQ